MTDKAHTEMLRGYRIDILTDDDCPSPRESTDCNLGFIVTCGSGDSRSRNHVVDSDAPTMPSSFPCAACDGAGRDETQDVEPIYNENTGALIAMGLNAPDCAGCQGDGTVPATFGALKRWAAQEYGATVVLALSGPHDWAGTWHVVDLDDGDDDVEGLTFDTAEQITKTGCPAELVDKGLRDELAEFNAWADGHNYGYRIVDVNDDEIGSCWGYTEPNGPTGYVLEAARDEVPDVESVRTYAVRLSAAQVSAIVDALESTELGAMFLDATERAGVPDGPNDED